MSAFEIMTDEEVAEYRSRPQEQFPKPFNGVQCLCGRFAKYAGDRHYYNGSFDCYSYDVDCSRCGLVTIECV